MPLCCNNLGNGRVGWHTRPVKTSSVPHHCSSQELKTTSSIYMCKFQVGKKKRLTKLITYTLIFYKSWVVKSVPAVQNLRVPADHCNASQGQCELVRQDGGWLILDALQHGAVPAVLRVAEDNHVCFFVVIS